MGYQDDTWLRNKRGPLPNIPPSTRPTAGGPSAQRSQNVVAKGKNPQQRPTDHGSGKNNSKYPQQSKDADGRTHRSNFNMYQPTVQHRSAPDMLLKHEFRRGMIIHAPLYEEDRNQGMSCAPSDFRSITALGIVFGKPRYMIVVGFHHDHYIAVGIYTHEKKGLKNKQNYKNEFISVRDGRIPKSKFTKLSEIAELVTDGKGAEMHPLSTVWYTRPLSRSYDLGITCHGNLTLESLTHLSEHIKEANNRMFE